MATSSLKPLRPENFDYWKAHLLLNRAGFGGTPGQVRDLANLGLDGAVDYILDYEDLPYEPVRSDAFDRDIMHPPTRDERMEQRRARQSGDEATIEKFRQQRQARQRADRRQMAEIQEWWLRRMIETPRPLEEKMTLFWHGHFATGYRAIEDSYHMFMQNQLFRSHAVGNFGALTYAIIRDPAMLRFLNNNQNRKQKPNENLARELMELFTLGEGHGYTENDIKEGARALTGYTYNDDDFIDLESRRFRQMHDQGKKNILGESGNWGGDDFVRIILKQRFVSEFICLKLYHYFVNDLPQGPDKDTQAFIRKLARKLRDSGYELKPMLRTLFRSQHFYDDANIAAQVKSPVQITVQTIRSLRTPTRNLRVLLVNTNRMGQHIFYPPSVKGWDGGRAWINTATLFVRQNLLVYLLRGQQPDTYAWQSDGADADITHLVKHLATGSDRIEPRDAAVYLLRFTLGSEPHAERVQTLVDFMTARGAPDDNRILLEVLTLVGAMPEFQLC